MAAYLMQWGRAHRNEIAVFFLVFGVRLMYALVIQKLLGGQAFTAYSDAGSFITATHNMLEHGVFTPLTEPPYVPDSLRTHGYAFFLALFFLLKIPTFGIVLAQHILVGLVGVMIYRIGKDILKKPAVGLIAAGLLAFEPTSIYWGNLLMSDNLFLFFFMLAIFLFLKKRWYWSSAVLGLAILTRPIGLYFTPILFSMMITGYFLGDHTETALWTTIKKTLLSKQFLKTIIVMGLLLLAVISPLMIRNKILFNTFQLSSVGWVNMHLFTSSPFARELGIPIPELRMPADYKVKNDVVFSYDFINVPFYKEFFFELVQNHPIEYLQFHLTSTLGGATYTGYDYLMNYVIRQKIPKISQNVGDSLIRAGLGLWIVFLAFAFLGFFKKDETRPVRLFFLCLFIWNSLLLAGSGKSQGGRYNLPIEPFVLLLAAYGICLTITFFRAKHQSRSQLTKAP